MKHKSHLSNPTLPPRPEASPSVFCHFWDDIVVGWQEQDRWTGEIGLPWRSEVTDIVSNGLMNIWCQIPILAGPDYLAHNTDFLWQQSRGSRWECLERCPDMTLVIWVRMQRYPAWTGLRCSQSWLPWRRSSMGAFGGTRYLEIGSFQSCTVVQLRAANYNPHICSGKIIC